MTALPPRRRGSGSTRGRSAPRRIAGPRPAARRPGPGASRTWLLGGATAAVLVGLVVAFLLLAGRPGPPTHSYVWLAEKTTAAAAGVPDVLSTALYRTADEGGGTLIAYAVGDDATRVAPISLSVDRQGSQENDKKLRDATIRTRLDTLGKDIDSAEVGPSGHSLYAALKAAADEAARSDGRTDVWLSDTFLSSTVDPFDIAQLTAGDPDAVVSEIMAGPMNRLDLGRVDLHPILLHPVGAGQEPLTAADEAWRTDFITKLGTRLGATVLPPVADGNRGPAWQRPSVVPLIVPLAVGTPGVPPPPCQATCVIDNLAFVPNTAALVDESRTRAAVIAFAAGLSEQRVPVRIEVRGYTAAFGSAESSRSLSLARATVIAGFLRAAGFPDSALDVRGLGFDERADPSQGARTAAQRVVVLRTIPTP